MTLLIAYILLAQSDSNGFWYFAVTVLWLFHVGWHHVDTDDLAKSLKKKWYRA
jgi:hypothetical protein